MKNQQALKWIIPCIAILALLAATMGLFYQRPGQSFSFTNHRGETVMINGQGMYFYDTVSMATQQQGNDLVTLTVGLPLLILSAWLVSRGSFRGRLLLTGTLGFFLYTYMSMAMLTSFNFLFLVYVALFSLSLIAFVLSMMSFDIKSLPDYFSKDLPHGWIAGLLLFVAGFLSLAWLGRIAQPLLQGQTAPLENTTTMVIQAMDLGLVVPLALLAGIFLLKRNPWGYLLAPVAVLKFVTMGLAVSSMAIMMAARGVPEQLGIVVPFMVITLVNLFMAVSVLKNAKSVEGHNAKEV